jgi:hypothetical protein
VQKKRKKKKNGGKFFGGRFLGGRFSAGDFRREIFRREILDRLLSPNNFPHKHHGAIPSRYAQIRAGEFGGWRTKEENEGGGQLVF